jgi:cytochrome c-type protein NapC
VSRKIFRSFALVLAAVIAGMPMALSRPAVAIDWSKVEAKKIVLMYPAQSSWERLMVRERHSGGPRFRDGKNCFACHGDVDEKPLGKALVGGERVKEPAPIAGKPGFQEALIKTARDAENMYVLVEFDPGAQPDAGQDKDYEAKVALMIDDGGVENANRAGCWVACHDDVATMARGSDKTPTKYLIETRVPGGAGRLFYPPELDKMKADGKFLEYWQARLTPAGKAVALDGVVLEKRTENMETAVRTEAVRSKAGVWTVTFTRKLTGLPGHKDIVPGKTYSVGFSIHTAHSAKRYHYVSFERTLVLDSGKADFVVTAQ